MPQRYKTAKAFRQALEQRIRSSGGDFQRLRQRVVFERLLARLFHNADAPWMLKGGYALELRLENRARATKDLDLTIPRVEWLEQVIEVDRDMSSEEMALEALRESAEIDLDDFFEFQIAKASKLALRAPQGGIRCVVECSLVGKYTTFHLDVGFGDAVTGSTEWVKGRTNLDFDEILSPNIGLIPITQHFAEKVHAYTLERGDRPNTRVKDLIDMVLILEHEPLDPAEVCEAAAIVFVHRNTHPLPTHFPEPPAAWAETYEKQAAELGLTAPTLESAHQRIAKFWEECHLK